VGVTTSRGGGGVESSWGLLQAARKMIRVDNTNNRLSIFFLFSIIKRRESNRLYHSTLSEVAFSWLSIWVTVAPHRCSETVGCSVAPNKFIQLRAKNTISAFLKFINDPFVCR